MAVNIDDEWNNFITNKYDNCLSDDETNETNNLSNNGYDNIDYTSLSVLSIPEPTPIYISTKSKIAYLTKPVDLSIFWDIPIIPYAKPVNGVIKKQIKINSKTPDELQEMQNKLKNELYCEQHIISHIDNPNGRIVFKDIRKITVGISRKDIMTYRSKKKQAFYNCFVMILRLKIDEIFKEFHIKVFNTGKLEIPGVQSEQMFQTVLKYIIEILQPFHSNELTYFEKSDTVLINSNFNCGFYINREVLYDILRTKYNIQAIYDPCSYPGIQCKFYYNNDIGVQNGMQITKENKDKYKNIIEVSFMIFRTGSVLIVGMCDEYVLEDIYAFLKALLKEEFKFICQKIISQEEFALKEKKKKIRRKIVNINIIDTNNTIENDVNKNDSIDNFGVTNLKNIDGIIDVDNIDVINIDNIDVINVVDDIEDDIEDDIDVKPISSKKTRKSKKQKQKC